MGNLWAEDDSGAFHLSRQDQIEVIVETVHAKMFSSGFVAVRNHKAPLAISAKGAYLVDLVMQARLTTVRDIVV